MTVVIPIPYNIIDYIISLLMMSLGGILAISTCYRWKMYKHENVSEERYIEIPIMIAICGIIVAVCGFLIFGAASGIIEFKTIYH